MVKFLAFTLAAVTGLAPLATAPALANDSTTPFISSPVMNLTPKCRDRPDAPFVGRVVGYIDLPPRGPESFVGCFYSLAECERWRVPVSGVISGRMVLNRCDPR